MAEVFDISLLNQYIEKTKLDADKVVRSTLIDLSAKIIMRTPVDTGRLINNWYPSFERVSLEKTGRTGKGTASVNRVKALLSADTSSGYTYYLTNNLPYAARIEYEGYSKVKAPAGMIRITAAELDDSLRKAVASID